MPATIPIFDDEFLRRIYNSEKVLARRRPTNLVTRAMSYINDIPGLDTILWGRNGPPATPGYFYHPAHLGFEDWRPGFLGKFFESNPPSSGAASTVTRKTPLTIDIPGTGPSSTDRSIAGQLASHPRFIRTRNITEKKGPIASISESGVTRMKKKSSADSHTLLEMIRKEAGLASGIGNILGFFAKNPRAGSMALGGIGGGLIGLTTGGDVKSILAGAGMGTLAGYGAHRFLNFNPTPFWQGAFNRGRSLYNSYNNALTNAVTNAMP